MNKQLGTIYFLLDEHHGKDHFSLLNFLKSIKHFSSLRYLKKCFIRKIKPVGGIKITYQHCLALKNAGYKTEIIRLGDYVDCFFNYEIEPIHINEIGYQLNSNDIVVATEFRPYNGLLFQNAKRILFAQNWLGFALFLLEKDQSNGFSGLGYQHILTCSQFIKNKLVEQDQHITQVVTNGIDLNVFKPDLSLRKTNRILALSRKNPEDLAEIKKFLSGLNKEYELIIADGLTEKELVLEYQKSDIFLATGYPEGFGLPPLEAMACGCVVVGFSGGGGLEYMTHGINALVADDGDNKQATQYLIDCLESEALKSELRKNALKTSLNFSTDMMNKNVIKVYSEFLMN